MTAAAALDSGGSHQRRMLNKSSGVGVAPLQSIVPSVNSFSETKLRPEHQRELIRTVIEFGPLTYVERISNRHK